MMLWFLFIWQIMLTGLMVYLMLDRTQNTTNDTKKEEEKHPVQNDREVQQLDYDIIFRVAEWFLSKGEPITPKRLQKLCYYAYAWYVVFENDEDALPETSAGLNKLGGLRFQAWVHGPTCPELYDKYRQYGANDIPTFTGELNLPDFVIDTLDAVWEAYGKYNAGQLEWMTHKEEPWIKARKGIKCYESCTDYIDEMDMFRFYSTQFYSTQYEEVGA